MQDWPAATEVAQAGLRAAQSRSIPSQIGDFYVTLSDIAKGKQDLPGALRTLVDAGDYLAITRDVARIQAVLSKSSELLAKLDTWNALLKVLSLVSTVMPVLERKPAASLCTFAVRNLLTRIQKDGWPASRDYLWQAGENLERALDRQKDTAPEQLRFLLDLVKACHDKSKGLQDKASAMARRLDEMSQKGFQLEAFISAGPGSQAKSTTP
jgi:hypothetical protein